MTPLVAYVFGLMSFPAAMGMVFFVRLMVAVLEQVRKEIRQKGPIKVAKITLDSPSGICYSE